MNFSWFEEEYNELQYPVKPSYTRYSIFKEGKVYASNLTLQELNEQKLKIEPNIELKKFGFTVEETFDENGFQNALNRYHRSKAGLVERLKNSLFEKYKPLVESTSFYTNCFGNHYLGVMR